MRNLTSFYFSGGKQKTKYEKWLKVIHDAWEKEWKEEKSERVASIHNRLVEIMAEEKAHIDEVIVALEILLQESLEAKMKIIREQSHLPPLSDKKPTVIK